MDLSKEEQEVLDNIREGITDSYQIQNFTHLSFEKIKLIFEKLEKLGFINILRKHDQTYNDEYWDCTLVKS